MKADMQRTDILRILNALYFFSIFLLLYIKLLDLFHLVNVKDIENGTWKTYSGSINGAQWIKIHASDFCSFSDK